MVLVDRDLKSVGVLLEADELPAEATGLDLAEVAYLRIRDAILNGHIPIGQPLSQVRLAKELGVSRTPLREALRRLQSEELIEGEPNRRVQVTALKVCELDQLYATRITLEALAARLTVPRLDDMACDRMKQNLCAMGQQQEWNTNSDYNRYEKFHRAFHMEMVSGAGERLVGTIARLHDHADRYRRSFFIQGYITPRNALKEHAALLDVCMRRDPNRIAAGLARHYAITALELVARLDPAYDPVATRTAVQQASR